MAFDPDSDMLNMEPDSFTKMMKLATRVTTVAPAAHTSAVTTPTARKGQK
jgi:hypothetical protein